MRSKITGEWLFTITEVAGRRAHARITVENVPAKDREFAEALARVAEVWLNRRRR